MAARARTQPPAAAEAPGVERPVGRQRGAVELGGRELHERHAMQRVQPRGRRLQPDRAASQLVVGTVAPAVHLRARAGAGAPAGQEAPEAARQQV